MTPRLALSGAAILMAAAVALGAFGAHALKTRVGPDALSVWQTAVNYHAWHALGLFGLHHAAWLFVAGIALFSGSLYSLALGAPAAVGIVTPFGGVAFIGGWLVLAFTARTLLDSRAVRPR